MRPDCAAKRYRKDKRFHQFYGQQRGLVLRLRPINASGPPVFSHGAREQLIHELWDG